MEHYKYDRQTDEIIVVKDRSHGWVYRKVFKVVGEILLFLLISALPIGRICWAVNGLMTGELPPFTRRGWHHTLYGNEALVWAWIEISLCVGVIGWVVGWLWEYRIIKWLLWAGALACLGFGMIQWLYGK